MYYIVKLWVYTDQNQLHYIKICWSWMISLKEFLDNLFWSILDYYTSITIFLFPYLIMISSSQKLITYTDCHKLPQTNFVWRRLDGYGI